MGWSLIKSPTVCLVYVIIETPKGRAKANLGREARKKMKFRSKKKFRYGIPAYTGPFPALTGTNLKSRWCQPFVIPDTIFPSLRRGRRQSYSASRQFLSFWHGAQPRRLMYANRRGNLSCQDKLFFMFRLLKHGDGSPGALRHTEMHYPICRT
jgi:hypothetical protein